MTYAVLFVLWLVVLCILKKYKMHFFIFIIGCVGLFVFLMSLYSTSLERALEYLITYSLWVIGKTSGLYTGYPEYSMITVYYESQAVSFFVNYECSGFIEILVYVCLLAFYPVYGLRERFKHIIFGTVYIFISNVIRVLLICLIVKFFGPSLFFISHTVFARLLFFLLMVILYYRVFTRPHILRQKVGKLNNAK